MKKITSQALKPRLTADAEIAFLDLREHGQYGEGHPFLCVSLPYSVLEQRVAVLIPRKSTVIVLMDDGDGVSERAARILESDGYTQVHVLQGGVHGWRSAGFGLFKGVNVPSKAFGEQVEHQMGTPSVSAEELKEWLDGGEKIIVLDGRSPKEFEKMSVPSARSCPNAELAYRWPRIVPDETTPVVVNCAGRTRSIIGAETLRRVGLNNPIFALRNGTQGWRLAGFDLCHGERPEPLPSLRPQELAASAALAAKIIEQHSIREISPEILEDWRTDAGLTTHLLDVRSQEEFERAHLTGARHAPGGQLVQATDEYVAVRNARLVLCDDTGLRAATTAMWLKHMGYDVSVLAADSSRLGSTAAPAPRFAESLSAEAALRHQATGAMILDASRGMHYRRGHIRGARWVTRARLDHLDIPKTRHIIVTAPDRVLVSGVVDDLRTMGVRQLDWFCGTPESWAAAGFSLETTDQEPSDADCIDYLFFVHDRHDGNLDSARRYLDWELGLLDQLDDQERGLVDLKKELP